MKTIPIKWDIFKVTVSDHKHDFHKYIYRGQANSEWDLSSSLMRTGMVNSYENFVDYFETLLPMLNEHVEAWSGIIRKMDDPYQLAQLLSIAQHNGYPTPLLDWSFSPYVAAFFAYDGIDHFHPQYDHVAIYSFNRKEWVKAFPGIPDYKTVEPRVDMITPKLAGNPKQMLQQSAFTFSNVNDIGKHIEANETPQKQFLTKYVLSVKERPAVLRDLALMGVTAMQLAPSLESVCRTVFHELCSQFELGPTLRESMTAKGMPTLEQFAKKPTSRPRKGITLKKVEDFIVPEDDIIGGT